MLQPIRLHTILLRSTETKKKRCMHSFSLELANIIKLINYFLIVRLD